MENAVVFVYATLFLCTMLIAMLVYRYDIYKKEPWYMLVATAAFGVLVMWLLGYIEDLSLSLFGRCREQAWSLRLLPQRMKNLRSSSLCF